MIVQRDGWLEESNAVQYLFQGIEMIRRMNDLTSGITYTLHPAQKSFTKHTCVEGLSVDLP